MQDDPGVRAECEDGRYTYSVTWSPEDREHVATCLEFPSISWLDEDESEALLGIRSLVAETIEDMRAHGEVIPEPLADRGAQGWS